MKTNWGLWTVRKEEKEGLGEAYAVIRYYKLPDGYVQGLEEGAVYIDEESARRGALELNKEEVTIQRRKLCRLLLPVLQETANLEDLTNLIYERATECVIATFQNGAQKRANIACDSGTAAIVDIIKQIT